VYQNFVWGLLEARLDNICRLAKGWLFSPEVLEHGVGPSFIYYVMGGGGGGGVF
jgi:hypothetical protein